MELVKCDSSRSREACGLLQLRQSYDLGEMYGKNYGYRSSLNRSMADHLGALVQLLLKRVPITSRDLVLDIGSNDGTLLASYPAKGPTLVGIDPTIEKFGHYYRSDILQIGDFFSADRFKKTCGKRKAKIVTSIAMFYDLPEPMEFMRQIREILADDGIWLFEQSYLPSMLTANAYDTICHEHVEYYAFEQIEFMADQTGFEILDVALNDTNGGSFAVTMAKKGTPYKPNRSALRKIREAEKPFHGLRPLFLFQKRIFAHRERLLQMIEERKKNGHRIFGYGASTKGNVILQFCGLTARELHCIAEVNEEKFGCVTPGSWIPIISEAEAHAMNPECFLVLPWHFKSNILKREVAYRSNGGKLLFPLPRIRLV
ncbi:MAG: class I SAM-dependent methyltransferase [Terriglobia bacterium]